MRTRFLFFLVGFALTMVVLSAAPVPRAEARCARPAVAAEARRSRYVFEGTLESVSGRTLTFHVTARWAGTPPERLTVSRSGRDRGVSEEDVGQSYLVFAVGPDDGSLSFSRCGSTGRVSASASALAALTAAGYTRSP